MGSNTWIVSVTLMFKCVPVLSSKLSPQKPEIAAFDLELSFYFGVLGCSDCVSQKGKGMERKRQEEMRRVPCNFTQHLLALHDTSHSFYSLSASCANDASLFLFILPVTDHTQALLE